MQRRLSQLKLRGVVPIYNPASPLLRQAAIFTRLSIVCWTLHMISLHAIYCLVYSQLVIIARNICLLAWLKRQLPLYGL